MGGKVLQGVRRKMEAWWLVLDADLCHGQEGLNLAGAQRRGGGTWQRSGSPVFVSGYPWQIKCLAKPQRSKLARHLLQLLS